MVLYGVFNAKQARVLARNYLGEEVEIFNVTRKLPSDRVIYNCPVNCWFVFCAYGVKTLYLGPPRVVCISKLTGEIVYDGSAGGDS
jgi:hypothetical protein